MTKTLVSNGGLELFYYKDPTGNFGDDLNAFLWPAILSPEMWNAEDVVLVGVGSILNENFLGRFANTSKRLIILGSGTSYGMPPRVVRNWYVGAVRGPLTATLIGMPEEAVTDGAILVAAAPRLVERRRPRSDILFIPNHRSVRSTRWERICRDAGLKFVSPREPVHEVLSAIAGARLVVAEAMHAAIIADTLRVPWIPVTVSPAIDEFKWRDWGASMNLPYEPQRLEAGHANDRRVYSEMEEVLRFVGISGHRLLADNRSREQLEDYFERRFSRRTRQRLTHLTFGRPGFDRIRRRLEGFLPRQEERVAEQLRIIAGGEGMLSSDSHFAQRLEQMLEAVRKAERYALSGRA
jgi:succinoglycan biosynthesis protein ExoV